MRKQYTKPMGYSKSVPTEKLIAVNTYIQTEERSGINNLTLHIKKLEKKLSQKLAEGRKQY